MCTYLLASIRTTLFTTTDKQPVRSEANTDQKVTLARIERLADGWNHLDVRQLEVGMEEIDALAVHET